MPVESERPQDVAVRQGGPRHPGRRVHRRAAPMAALALAAVTSLLATLGAGHTSLTFDETFMVPSGVQGFRTGAFDMTIDHPPLMQYLYGLPVYLTDPAYPPDDIDWDARTRFPFGQMFFHGAGNDGRRLLLMARAVAAVIAGLLVLLTYAFTARRLGQAPALLAAGLVAFLPDVLAHGGVAYNDLPLAAAFLGALWAVDAAARRPDPARGALAGIALAVALTVKNSALALLPIALLIIGMEAWARRHERRWWRGAGSASLAGVGALYLSLVLLYGLDFGLERMWAGLRITLEHASGGHGTPAFLLGQRSLDGFWYFYPLVFLLKTPAALHLLVVCAAVGYFLSRNEAAPGWLRSPLRPIAVGAVVFLVFLLRANLNIGFRHALPLLPLVCILVAAGAWRLARRGSRVRALVLGLAALHAVSTLAYYPHFLTYLSEYVDGRRRGAWIIGDSSLDWGQGLIELRKWMDEQGVERVYLAYFGSDVPSAHGIDYVPLPSFFPLARPPAPDAAEEAPPQRRPTPSWIVVSATLLSGQYLRGDPYAPLREREPAAVIANHLYVYPSQPAAGRRP